MERFSGRVVVVTGGASGIGEATVREFAGEGAAVLVVDIDAVRGQALQEELRGDGRRAAFVRADVADAAACRRAIAEARQTLGGVNYLVNCAASFVSKGLDATPEDWQKSLGVNVQGCANMVQAAADALRDAGGGAVVNIASISAYIAQPNRWTYNATKGAIVTMTKCQAFDLAPHGIRVNSISPGWIWTPVVDAAAGGDRAKWEPIWGRFHMLRRCAEPREVARAILFLCSDDASFITAVDLPVDGGYLGLGGEGLGDVSVFAGE
jgi:NAD(P)-dependent dehydrogenase (short-subunit alcohol dehydrogenase family)